MLNRSKELIALSQEAVEADGTAHEIEHVWYAKLSDFEQLSNAVRSEHHEQCEYWTFNKNGDRTGMFRSREIDRGESHVATIKSFSSDHVGAMETNLIGHKEMHVAICNIAQRKFRKVRYVFPVTVSHQGENVELNWEVDLFMLPDGENHPWVKIDLEVPSADVPPPTKFPIQFDEIFNAHAELNDEQRAVIDTIFSKAAISEQ